MEVVWSVPLSWSCLRVSNLCSIGVRHEVKGVRLVAADFVVILGDLLSVALNVMARLKS